MLRLIVEVCWLWVLSPAGKLVSRVFPVLAFAKGDVGLLIRSRIAAHDFQRACAFFCVVALACLACILSDIAKLGPLVLL